MYTYNYTYKWLFRVSAHPRFLTREFKTPWALTWENMVVCATCSLSDAHNYYFAPLLFPFTEGR